MGRPESPKKSPRTKMPGCLLARGLRLFFGRLSDDARRGLTHDDALNFILLGFLFFASWCVFVSHGYSLPRIAAVRQSQ
jgi:hypothetical protein